MTCTCYTLPLLMFQHIPSPFLPSSSPYFKHSSSQLIFSTQCPPPLNLPSLSPFHLPSLSLSLPLPYLQLSLPLPYLQLSLPPSSPPSPTSSSLSLPPLPPLPPALFPLSSTSLKSISLSQQVQHFSLDNSKLCLRDAKTSPNIQRRHASCHV